MLIKKLILIGIILLFLISAPCVIADENITENESFNTDGNFTQLSCEIENSKETLNLNKNYIDNTEITLNKSMTINGNGHSIASRSECLKINIDNDINLILKNITFKNDKIDLNIKNSTIKLIFIDCSFNKKSIKNQIYIEDYKDSESYRVGNVSETVRQVALEIVGKSTDLEAAKKLAIWVGKNIKHETAPGFYQSPDETLNRSLGNCCSQTLLFLQMCESVGLNKDHKLYFVHVGTSMFHHRHFFAMIDSTFVDVDSRPSAPWGNADTINNKFYIITEYPYLPLVKKY